MCFTGSGTAGQQSPLTISDGTATNGSGQAQQFVGADGNISITSVNSGEFALIGGNVSVLEGDEVCVPVSVNGFKNILTMQFDMAYDQNMLEFVGFRNLSLAGLTEEKFGKPGEGRVAMGQITFAWIDDSAKGVTLPDGTVIFEVCFRTKGAAGSQTMFQFDETFAEVADAGSKVLPFKGLDGMVNIISNSIPDFTLSGVNQTVASGNQVCLPVKANGFTGLKKLSFEMNYDATLLEWVGVQNIAVTGATVANFDVSVAGTIKFTWQSGDNGGLTLPNATNLFEICLKAKGSSTVTTTFQFKDTGATVEDEEGTALGFRNTDASITIQGLLAPDEFGLVTSGADVKQGESICLPVRVNGFTKIVALQFSMQFDPAILAFDTLMNSRFADLIYGKPGAGGVGANEISILWDDDRQTGVTLSNGETLFEICFKVIGNPGSLTNVGYYDNGAEIVNANSNVLPFKGLAGSVNIVSDVQNLAIASGEVTDAACFNGRNGSVNITLQGGQAPYTFRWSNDAVTEDLVGVPAGNYTVTVTDSRGGAGIVQSFEVKQPAAIAIAETLTNVACFGADSGTIQLQVSGGTGAYQFNWSGAAGTGSQATGLKAGTYRVTVTDANACTIRDTFMLTENPALRVNSSIVPINNNKAGSIEITANGGNGAYGYQWSGPENFVSTQEDLTNLSKEGNYSVTVTDGLGCTFTSTIELPKNTQALAATVLRGEEARCNGEASGKAVINIAGGCAPYTISAGEQSATDADGAEAILDGLAAGTYEITVQDDCGATFSAGSVTIQQPTPLQYTTAITSDLLDAGCTGVIRVSGSGGTGTLSYQWNNNRNGAELNNLCAGDYRMTVTDSRGCQLASQLITVTPFGVVKADSKITDTNCPADPSGKIMPAVTGGQAPLQYEWLDAGGNKVGDTKDLSKVLAGIYTLRITEASGQLVEQSFTIGSMSSLSAEVAVLTNFNGFGVSCPGNKDGRLEAKVRSGTGTYEYRWSNGASGAMLDQVAPGMYTVSITDAFGCMVKVDTELSAPAAITGTITTDPVSCSGDADGEARVADLAGGVGAYTVNWGDQTGMVAMNLAAGTYTATVTDGNGCRQTLQGTVAAPAPLEITFATESDKGAQDGSATALAAGGSAPYQFEWNTGAATSRLNQLKYGEYKVRVTDANGCEAEAVTTISAAFDCLSMRKVITPDGDGFNENFVINCLELFPDNKLEVFNRWGQMVFEHKNYDNSWEGTDSRGSDLPAGGYFFVFKYTDPNNGESLQEKGGVTIIRE